MLLGLFFSKVEGGECGKRGQLAGKNITPGSEASRGSLWLVLVLALEVQLALEWEVASPKSPEVSLHSQMGL